jgi:hypothetical protein
VFQELLPRISATNLVSLGVVLPVRPGVQLRKQAALAGHAVIPEACFAIDVRECRHQHLALLRSESPEAAWFFLAGPEVNPKLSQNVSGNFPADQIVSD